jgi:hypothetical protein
MLSPVVTTSHQVMRFDPNQYRIRQAAFNYGIAEAKRIRDWALLEEAVDIKIAEQSSVLRVVVCQRLGQSWGQPGQATSIGNAILALS